MKILIKTIFLISLWVTDLSGVSLMVINSGSETLSRIDLTTGNTDNSFASLGAMANRMALTEDWIYVVNSGDNNIQKINSHTGQTEAYIYLGVAVNPYDIIINDDKCYVTGAISHQVYQIDLVSEIVENSCSVGDNPAGMAIWQNLLFVGNTDYGSNYTECSVSVLDLEDFSILATIPVAANPQYLIEYNGKIHVCCTGNWADETGKVLILDPVQLVTIETIYLGGFPGSLAVLADETVYLGDSMNSGVYAYNAEDYSVLYDADNPFLPGGSSVCANNENLAVLGGNWGDNFTVRVYDLEEELIGEYTVGMYGTQIAFQPESSSNSDNQMTIPIRDLCNYPNPVLNDKTGRSFGTTITFSLTTGCSFELSIYNIKGQKIKKFSRDSLSSGRQLIFWNGLNESNSPVPGGLYFYTVKADNYIRSAKMLLIR
ncbi:MAG: T9SS type A sorting domain-containing protein [Candidatus Cloacimonetes bacterium]|nr:T9SS type A sorting domain-containing protein [Candidatus Cloacimonadota bacterium]